MHRKLSVFLAFFFLINAGFGFSLSQSVGQIRQGASLTKKSNTSSKSLLQIPFEEEQKENEQKDDRDAKKNDNDLRDGFFCTHKLPLTLLGGNSFCAVSYSFQFLHCTGHVPLYLAKRSILI